MSVSIIGIGDVVINGELTGPTGKDSVYDRLRGVDSCFANLEMPFSKDGYPAEKLIPLRCDPQHAHVIRDVGIDVVTVANNHGMDYGFEGLRTTTKSLEAVGVGHVGIGENIYDAYTPYMKTVNGVRVAYLGVATTLPNGAGAGKSRPGLAGVRVFSKFVVDAVTIDESPGMAPFVETETYKPDEEVLLRTIRDVRERADIVLVAIHWGVPYGWIQNSQDEIATYQRPLARAMIDAGASAVFGHHPHVVQGVELYSNAPIFYSLGNFIFSNNIVTPAEGWRTYPPYSWKSLQQTLSNIGALAKVSWLEGKLASCSLIPVTVAENGEPLETCSDDAEVLLARLRALSDDGNIRFDMKKQARGYEIVIVFTNTAA